MSSTDTSKPTNTTPPLGDKHTKDDDAAPTSPSTSNATPSAAASSTTESAQPSKPAPATPKPAASRKPRCNFKSCNALAQRVVGDCGFCNGKFCGKHRLLESHSCSGLEDCKDEARERNKERLETERTVVVRGV